MGLGSVLQTALSGMSAAETAVAVVANNLANARTPGFKASTPQFATQTPQTYSAGRAPSGSSGGTNPVQVGRGVTLAGTSTDFSQGTIAMGGDSLSLAIEGEGLFILEGPRGERLLTRDGRFQLNANRELVTADGHRVLGFGTDGSFQLQTTRLVPLRIPAGAVVATPSGGTAELTGFSVGSDGRIRGRFSDGRSRDLGQIRLARTSNPSGLQQRGGTRYATGPNSGLAVETNPQEGGAGAILAGATELSNTDLGRSLVDLQLASDQFRAGVQVTDTAVSLLDELVNLRRPAR